jgi:hypothetical protein
MPEFVSKVATPVSIGFMSAADKVKLDGLTPGGGGSAILTFGDSSLAAGADTRFLDPSYQAGGTAGIVIVEQCVTRAGTLKNLVVRVQTGGGLGNTTYTVMVNGVATAITVTVANPTPGQQIDIVNSVAVLQGDRVAIRAVKNNAGGAPGIRCIASLELA